MILSETFVRRHIFQLRRDIEELKEAVSIDCEVERFEEYKIWLADLEAYHQLYYPSELTLEQRTDIEVFERIKQLNSSSTGTS